MSERIAILGAGSWGLAIAGLLADAGHEVSIWSYSAQDCATLQKTRQLPDKLPSFRLNETIAVTTKLSESLRDVSLIVLATPSQFARGVLRDASSLTGNGVGIVNLAKGIELGSLKRMSEIIREEIPNRQIPLATLSGPSHAEEVVRDMPTTVVVAGDDPNFAKKIQDTFSTGCLRVYSSPDLIGVELGGSLKNCIAIAAGIAQGLGYGDNTLGALIARGLAEITRLGLAIGAKADTFFGLSGLGDLVTTCASPHSRNRAVGQRIARGETVSQIRGSMSMIAEGIDTTRSAYELGKKYNVEMPIVNQMYRVLFENASPNESVATLMGRSLKPEVWA